MTSGQTLKFKNQIRPHILNEYKYENKKGIIVGRSSKVTAVLLYFINVKLRPVSALVL